MPKRNFQAWFINLEDFFSCKDRREKLSFLVKFGVLAPSSHNSQPWKFRVGDDFIEVLPDFARALPATDERHSQLYVSLGCALENILIAADAYGIAGQVSYRQEGDHHLARLTFSFPETARSTIPEKHRIHVITKRATNRSPHESRPIPDDLIKAIEAENNDQIRAHFVTEQEKRHKIADYISEGADISMSDTQFRHELADYMIPNNSHKGIGMTGDTIGLGLVGSWILPKVLRRVNPRDRMREQDHKLYKEQTTAFVVVTCRDDSPEGWMEAGRAYMRLALDAELVGATTNNHAAPIAPRPVQKKLADLVGSQWLPQLCFRIGFPTKPMPHSPRLTAQETTEAA